MDVQSSNTGTSSETAAEQRDRLFRRLGRTSLSEMEGPQFQSFVDELKGLSAELTELEFPGDFLEVGNEKILNVIGKAIEDVPFPSLQVVSLTSNWSTRVGGLKDLAAAFQSGNLLDLKELHLRTFSRPKEDNWGEILATVIQGGHWQSLEILDLTGSRVRDHGVGGLARASGSGNLRALKTLDLGSCRFGVEGATALATAIQSGHLRSLETLNLRNNDIEDDGLGSLAAAFQSGNVLALQNLSFGECGREGANALAHAIQSGKLPALKTLEWVHYKLGGEGEKALARIIQAGHLRSLQSLSLVALDTRTGGLTDLTEAFQSGELPSLSFLHIRCHDEALLGLPNMLRAQCFPSLEFLSIDGAGCSRNAAEALRDAYAFNRNLVAELRLSWGNLTRQETSADKFRERNKKLASMFKQLHGEREVPASHGKVFLCGSERQGKTTLSKSLQKVLPASMSRFAVERVPHREPPTRGIRISHIGDKGANTEVPLAVAIWDLAGQHEYYILHNAFLPDLAFADGKATTFVIVCNARYDCSATILHYWMRFIASSSRRGKEDGKRHVFLVLNLFNNKTLSTEEEETWKYDLNMFRDKFHAYLDIHPDLFIVDARVQRSVKNLKAYLLNHTTQRLKLKTMPEICRSLDNVISEDVRTMEFPVITLQSFFGRYRSRYSASDDKLKAALEYLHESGHVIYFREGSLSEGVDSQRSLVVLDPDYVCQKVVGRLLLPERMLKKYENPLSKDMFEDGSIRLQDMVRYLRHLHLSHRQMQDNVAILLRLGLCYKIGGEKVLIPALLDRVEIPVKWRMSEMISDQWVMGFCLKVLYSETTLLPISVFRRLQVDLAQDPMCSNFSDSCYAVGKNHITFEYKAMMVLVEFSALEDRLDILVKPLVNNMDAKTRREQQVDLAHTIVEKFVTLSETWCPGVEFMRLVVKPWCTSQIALPPMESRDISMSVDELKRRICEHGIDEKLNWPIGDDDLITAIELLSEGELGDWQRSEESRVSVIEKAIVDLCLIPQDEDGQEDSMNTFDEVVETTTHQMIEMDQQSPSKNSSHEHWKPSISQNNENSELHKVFHGFKNSLKRSLKRHMDTRFDRLDSAIQNIKHDMRITLDRQKKVLHKLQALEVFSIEEKTNSVPRFMYLTKSNDASTTWVRLSLTNLVKEKMTLHFLCEAHHSLHEVKGQEGVQINDLKKWAAKIAPWVEWSLRAAYVIGNIASQAVLPGLSQLISTFPVGGDSEEATGVSMTIAYLCTAAGLVGGETSFAHLTTSMNLKGSSVLRPIETKEGFKDILRELIGELRPREFHKKFSLRCVMVKKSGNVIWICDDCLRGYKKSNLVEEL